MLLNQAREGFMFHQQVANHSPRTLEWYREKLSAFETYLCSHAPDPSIETIATQDLLGFIAYLQTRQTVYENVRFRKPQSRKLSAFTIDDFYRALKTFFRWAAREKLITANPMEGAPRPKVPKAIKPRFSEQEIRRLLKACEHGAEGLAIRNQAIILTLLDSGMRASELCGLTLDRLDPEFRRAHLIGKGMKDRYVPLGARAREALWRYVHVYRPSSHLTNCVFLTVRGGALNAHKLNHILTKVGARADVSPCNPHRFRHTAARLYLRNGGDVFTLQQLLGHEGLETTRLYAQTEREDLERTHARVSPVDRLAL